MNLKHLLGLTLLIGANAAHAHAKLESSDPKAAAIVDRAPKLIRLQFNEALEPAFSKITLNDAANHEVPLPKAGVDQSNPKVMTAAVPPLAAGEYRVQWSTVTHDGHKTKGEFSFKVR